MRLDKYLCESTELSRAEAKRLLRGGDVTCNGKVIKSGSFKVPEAAEVRIEGNLLSLRGLRYIMLNKPVDFISSTTDDDYPSVLNLLDIDKISTLHIAGRLDVDTTGLLLITDDGQWSHKLMSPKKVCGKRYRVELTDPIQDDAVETFANGVGLRGEKTVTKPAKLEILSPTEVLLTITEGKYHQVKRMFAAIGNKVERLHREQVGQIELDESLAPGEWRYLTAEEVNSVT
ncbi:16S rRNA pseudouridylate synthase [Endozoicomonas montiporae]|uniref:Pseudouridine synthase n=2 Tax=Endozoicomonas montiporae TaxID=1027273 RepID=A0A081N470_9GAMM|nr:16S rRNA pseudouridine(516) synthase RsuA [Endozoicomonas montiporae]AMO57918.1 pseudouridine synthase [Endozoicomonas montiporae CL-33]KEQ13243.1 16S rRNA pseudouridylate synthase [Endozoicomonas montiporae]